MKIDMTTDQIIYNELAQELADHIPEDWGAVKLTVQYAKGQWTEVAWYQRPGQEEWVAYDCGLSFLAMKTRLADLKAYTTENQFVPWNTFDFEVNEAGKFSIDFRWDQQYQDEVEGVAT